MTENEILSELTAIFRDVFRDSSLTVTPTLSAEDVEKWDSLAHVDMLAAVEERFQIRIPSWQMASLQNVGDLVQAITERLK